MPFEDFLSYVKFEKRYSNHTLASYETDLNQFASFIDSMSKQMQNAGPRDIRLWIAGLSDNHAPSTVNRKLSTIKSFYKFLLKTERIKSNPAKDLTNLKAPQRTPQFIDEKELLHLFEQLPIADDFKSARNLLIFDLFYATGMRKSELIALKHTDLDESSKSVKVLGKGKKERKIGFTLRVGGGRSPIDDRRNWDGYIVNNKVVRINSEQGLKMMGFPKSFKMPVTENQAMKQLGNSVAVNVVKAIGKEVKYFLDTYSKNKS
mgnify:CR=1 FL=1